MTIHTVAPITVDARCKALTIPDQYIARFKAILLLRKLTKATQH